MSDLDLKKAVETELAYEPSINAAEIGVASKDGIITLSGRVPSYWEKVAAERAAERVTGVKAVVNELEVRLGSIAVSLRWRHYASRRAPLPTRSTRAVSGACAATRALWRAGKRSYPPGNPSRAPPPHCSCRRDNRE